MSKAAYSLMRELTVLSLNIYYVKENIQKFERHKASLLYINISTGPIDVILLDLENRKRSLQKRFKKLFEVNLVELNESRRGLILALTLDQAGWKRKELEKGYAIISDILDKTYLLDLRTGILNNNTAENIRFFEERIRANMGPVYHYFHINIGNPLTPKNLRY